MWPSPMWTTQWEGLLNFESIPDGLIPWLMNFKDIALLWVLSTPEAILVVGSDWELSHLGSEYGPRSKIVISSFRIRLEMHKWRGESKDY